MRKDAQICLRLTKLQKEKILAKASQVNMNITDYRNKKKNNNN